MRKVLTLFVSLVMVLTIAGNASAVDFAEELQKLAKDNAKGYIGPFATAFGTAMNSGLYHTAKTHGLGGFDISFKMALVSVPDDAQSYDFFLANLPIPVDAAWGLGNIDVLNINMNTLYPDRSTPTVFGEDQGGTLNNDPAATEVALEQALMDGGMSEGEINTLKGTPAVWNAMVSEINSNLQPIPTVPGIGISTLPLVIPQLSVGLIMDTEVMLRYIPEIDAGDIGKVKFLGLGVKHGLDQWIPIPMFPVNITGQFVWQKLEVGDILESNHTAFNIEASKKLGIGISITPYIGMGTESSDLKVNYTIDTGDPTNPLNGSKVEFDLDGDNGFRMTAGARIAIPLITLNVDYSLGEYSSLSAGFGITFR